MNLLRKTIVRTLMVLGALVLLVTIGGSLVYTQVLPSNSLSFFAGALRGGTHFVRIPPYLFSTNYTTTGTKVVKTTAGVVGCVIINKAGAAGSTIGLYATNNTTYYGIKATIDATQVGQFFCYGSVFSDGITAVSTSGGAAPDFTVTWR